MPVEFVAPSQYLYANNRRGVCPLRNISLVFTTTGVLDQSFLILLAETITKIGLFSCHNSSVIVCSYGRLSDLERPTTLGFSIRT